MKPNIGSGDSGETGLLGKRRVRKDSPQVEALGAIDEAAAAIGVARAAARKASVKALLVECQSVLKECAAAIAAAGTDAKGGFDFAKAARDVEAAIARQERAAGPPTSFAAPGTTQCEAALHLARAIARRAERRVFALNRSGCAVDPCVPAYLNRLSDLLFDLAYGERKR